MLKRPVTQDDFAGLESERLAAGQSYNEALTGPDRAIPPPRSDPCAPRSSGHAQYLLTASGFQQIQIRYRSPLPQSERLQPIAIAESTPAALRDTFETLNENAERLNRRLFSHMDYAAVAVRL